MHGKRGFSGFLGDKALPSFDLSFISSQAFMPLLLVKQFLGMHGKRGFSGFSRHKSLPWFKQNGINKMCQVSRLFMRIIVNKESYYPFRITVLIALFVL